MEIITHIIIGTLVGIVGYLPPSMINMTAVGVSLKKNIKAGMLFTFGASIIIFFQSWIALACSEQIFRNEWIIEYLKKGSVFIFFGLAIFFFIQSRKKCKAKAKESTQSEFQKGSIMSALNFVGIPFFLFLSSSLASNGWIIINPANSLYFSIGALIGTILILGFYVYAAKFVEQKLQFIAKNLNLILAILFLILGLSQIKALF